MGTSELISLSAAIAALLISAIGLVFNGIQTIKAVESNSISQQLERGHAVTHFTTRFFDLIKDGGPEERLGDVHWATQYWSLQATEFYFFHHCMLPTFMYALWMIELAKLYSGPDGGGVHDSQMQYMRTYSITYPEMWAFFAELFELARARKDDEITRNRVVGEFVNSWHAAHKRKKLQ